MKTLTHTHIHTHTHTKNRIKNPIRVKREWLYPINWMSTKLPYGLCNQNHGITRNTVTKIW